jgi:hypothetical protein
MLYEFVLPSVLYDFADGIRVVIFMRSFCNMFLRSTSVTVWDLRFLCCICGAWIVTGRYEAFQTSTIELK